MRLYRLIPVILMVAAFSVGCSRKPPRPFKFDEPRTVLPVLDSTDRDAALALIPDNVAGRCPADPGVWEAGIERRISMRSNTLARTDISSTVGLSLSVGETSSSNEGFITPFRVAGVSAAVTSLNNQEESGRLVAAAWQGLTFDCVAGPGMKATFRSPTALPPELGESFPAMLPILPDRETMRAGAWELTRTRDVALPGGAVGLETVTGTGRLAGVSAGRAVVRLDWKSSLSGATRSGGVTGRITGGSGVGRAICRFTLSGLESCEVSESRTHSVTLSVPGARARLLEQKVSVDSTFSRQP